ncbi:tRNA (adenosine(37)-N6)-threonylcarbamoyltransferase complex ATPase subunit type 1 TsaE [Actinomycetota bacterium]|nr:tRNA (adenosine(37)-N6)-threonylcarbamoyltransferase complex ATPase subunit type 1 TsaE [Actinomycetota bacterium]
MILNSVDETNAFAAEVARDVKVGDIIFLNGELGAGKTTWTKAFAAALGVVEPVLSPTFVLGRAYNSGRLPFLHIDAYRLVDLPPKAILQQLETTELEDYLEDGVVVVEWGAAIASSFPRRTEINISVGVGVGVDYQNGDVRQVEVVKCS